MNVIIVGGGAAGLMAAISSGEEGNKVIILEKNSSCGKKIEITGKGRCNITNNMHISEFIKNTPGNGMFMYSAFSRYTNKDVIKFFHDNGLNTKVERGERVFPVSDNAKDVVKVLINKAQKLNVTIRQNSKVIKILTSNGKISGVELESGEKIYGEKVVIATGGKSYPVTGSTGDGYRLAKEVGHTITEIKPSLVPLETYKKELCLSMQGVSLKNVAITVEDIEEKKIIYKDFGEMLFTHFGISGPIVLSASAYIQRYKNIKEKLNNKSIVIKIDLKPALTYEMLDARILRDFSEIKNKEFKNAFNKLLPRKMIEPLIELTKIDEKKKINEITKKEREIIINALKNLKLTISGFRPIEEAIITSGGINIKEINPKTMESKIIKGLYFAGEVIDVDSLTGGFNLQIAWSTGFVAGK